MVNFDNSGGLTSVLKFHIFLIFNCEELVRIRAICEGLVSSNGCHSGPIFFKPEKNLEFFRLKNWPIDDYPGRLE